MPLLFTDNKKYLLPIILLSFVILALLTISVFILTPKIQNDLAVQIKDAFITNTVPAKITLSGRDVTLSGVVPDEETRTKAEAITRKICGIRFIDNQLLTEKTENLALLRSNIPAKKTTIATKAKPEPKLIETPPVIPPTPIHSLSQKEKSKSKEIESKHSKKKANQLTTYKPEHADQEKTIIEKAENSDELNKKQTTDTSNNSDKLKWKKKSQYYDNMLAAMNAYKQKKGRNAGRSSTPLLSFKKDSDTLLPTSNKALDKWVNYLTGNKGISIEVSVFSTDSSLSLMRAKTIRNYLKEKGIETSRIKITGQSGKSAVDIREISK